MSQSCTAHLPVCIFTYMYTYLYFLVSACALLLYLYMLLLECVIDWKGTLSVLSMHDTHMLLQLIIWHCHCTYQCITDLQ